MVTARGLWRETRGSYETDDISQLSWGCQFYYNLLNSSYALISCMPQFDSSKLTFNDSKLACRLQCYLRMNTTKWLRVLALESWSRPQPGSPNIDCLMLDKTNQLSLHWCSLSTCHIAYTSLFAGNATLQETSRPKSQVWFAVAMELMLWLLWTSVLLRTWHLWRLNELIM